MSLYIVNTNKVRTRRAQYVFYQKKSSWFYYSNKEETLFAEVTYPEFDVYLSIIQYAEAKGIPELEIQLGRKIYWGAEDDIGWEYYRLIESLAAYLLDKDISVGLLVKDSFAFLLRDPHIFENLGAPIFYDSHPRIVRDRVMHPSFLPSRGDDGKRYCDAAPSIRHEGAAPAGVPFLTKLDELAIGDIRLDEPFRDKLMKYLIESNKTNAEIYHKAGVSKQVFSKIISSPDMVPTKGTVLCLAIGLELKLKETVELLQSAGYALSKSIRSDMIIAAYIKMGIYDLDRINQDLNEYGCPILGWKPRDD